MTIKNIPLIRFNALLHYNSEFHFEKDKSIYKIDKYYEINSSKGFFSKFKSNLTKANYAKCIKIKYNKIVFDLEFEDDKRVQKLISSNKDLQEDITNIEYYIKPHFDISCYNSFTLHEKNLLEEVLKNKKEDILIGYPGYGFGGYTYAPYVPLIITPIITGQQVRAENVNRVYNATPINNRFF